MKITVVQQDIIWNDVEANLQRMERLFKAAPKSDIYLFPEMCSTGFTLKPGKMAERVNGATAQRMLQWAAKYDAAFAGSVMTVDDEGRFYNRMYFARPDGRLDHYDKCNLFIYSGEDKVYTAGKEAVMWEFRGARIRPAICYDIRFPVWCRNKDNEYDLLIAVANWPQVRVDAWNQLLKARAIENEAYVCGVNCKGTDNYNFLYTGDSAAIDFKGKAINICQEDSDIIYAVLDHEKLDAFRTKFPAWKDADPFTLTDI